MGQKGLIVFIRNPELGKVKTRIAATAGPAEALRIYKELLAHTRRVTLGIEANRYLYYVDVIAESDDWPSEQYRKLLQPPGDLGDKMSAALDRVLTDCDKAIIIGSDCASLTTEHIEDAFAALDESDIVIGPTLDGGYYLLGMKQPHYPLFTDIDWSTDRVFSQTLRAITSLSLSYTALKKLSDIDYEEDWVKYGW